MVKWELYIVNKRLEQRLKSKWDPEKEVWVRKGLRDGFQVTKSMLTNFSFIYSYFYAFISTLSLPSICSRSVTDKCFGSASGSKKR